MDSTVLTTLISAASGLLVAVVGGLFAMETRRRKSHDAKTEARAEIRAKESRLSMGLMSAAVKGVTAIAIAVEEGKTNGEMRDAREAAEAAQAEYFEFISGVAAQTINK